MRRSRNFDREFNRTKGMVSIIFAIVIFIKVMMLCMIGYGLYLLFTSGLTLDGIGHAIGSFIGSVQEGMNQ